MMTEGIPKGRASMSKTTRGKSNVDKSNVDVPTTASVPLSYSVPEIIETPFIAFSTCYLAYLSYLY